MALKITKSSESIKVSNVVVTIYGSPGSGKSSLAYTAESPILLDFDKGAHRAFNRSGDTALVTSWSDVAEITANDLAGIKTVVIDTVGNMIKLIIAHISSTQPAKARNNMLLYGEVGKIYEGFVTKIKSFGMDLVFISHFTEEKDNDQIKIRLAVGGKARDDVYSSSDLLGYLSHINGVRQLDFNPVDGRIGKNTGNFAPFDLSNGSKTTLADIIQQLKGKMNELSEEQTKAKASYDQAIELIDAADDAETFNSLTKVEFIAGNSALKQYLHNQALAKGLVGNRTTKQYEVKGE